MEEFEKFWKAYPRKVAKGEARKAWTQTEKIRPPVDKIIQALEVAKKQDQWRKDNGMFIPHAATWLRAERWDDDYGVDLGEDVVEVGGKVTNWWETATGIEQKGQQLGLKPEMFGSFPEFKAAVMRQTMRAA